MNNHSSPAELKEILKCRLRKSIKHDKHFLLRSGISDE